MSYRKRYLDGRFVTDYRITPSLKWYPKLNLALDSIVGDDIVIAEEYTSGGIFLN
jgi:hypothetical protein